MMSSILRATLLAVVGIFYFQPAAWAQFFDQIGLTTLRAVTTNLNGSGVKVGQAEAGYPGFEVNPAFVGQPTNLFTWVAGSSPYLFPPSQTSTFTNSLGTESNHAGNVGNDFYGLATNAAGIPYGVATNVAHVNNYDADTFVNYYVNNNHTISERIVNQSFTWGSVDTNVDQIFDNYAAQHNVLFVSGAGKNANPVWSPATCYNGIGVGVFNNGGSPYGPTPDGRSKPDLTAPGVQDTVTSYSTPLVSGAAAVLLQAALRGDGGSDTNSAGDIRTLKALLLNGAVKPADWTNSASAPLHARYGAGVLNIFNSYKQLAGGKNYASATNQISLGATHPPVAITNSITAASGWNFGSVSSGTTNDTVHHYFFSLTNSPANFTGTATLAWNRQRNQSAINNLDLFLYDCANSNLVLCSTSLVDNVEHLYATNLPPGRYDLQVWKAGGGGIVSAAETYALVFAFSAPALSLTKSGMNAVLTWPLYPAGYLVVARTNLLTDAWSTNNLPASTLTGSTNILQLPMTNALQFFRLRSPNF